MSLDLLDAPLRVTWNLFAGTTPAPSKTVRQVVRRLADAGVFFVSLESGALNHPDASSVVATLSRGGCQVILGCHGDPQEISSLPTGWPVTLQLDVQSVFAEDRINPARLRSLITAVRNKKYEPIVSVVPTPQTLPLIPELLALCRQERIKKVKLPNTPLSLSDDPSTERLTAEDIVRFSSQCDHEGERFREEIDLEVHDLFIWEVFFPDRDGGRSEYGGCQAANSLGHVDGEGNLYPCSSWPERLGSLLRDSIQDLWQSPLRYRIRDEIDKMPEGCAGCKALSLCLGGCRGLGRFVGR
ncbi:MAG: hypothetical protein C0621_06280, partial [Desulfuromonas sp.]